MLDGGGGSVNLHLHKGLTEDVQWNVARCSIFPSWVWYVISRIEAGNLIVVSNHCTEDRHRSVAAAEIIKRLYYPSATMDHLTSCWWGLSLRIRFAKTMACVRCWVVGKNDKSWKCIVPWQKPLGGSQAIMMFEMSDGKSTMLQIMVPTGLLRCGQKLMDIDSALSFVTFGRLKHFCPAISSFNCYKHFIIQFVVDFFSR